MEFDIYLFYYFPYFRQEVVVLSPTTRVNHIRLDTSLLYHFNKLFVAVGIKNCHYSEKTSFTFKSSAL